MTDKEQVIKLKQNLVDLMSDFDVKEKELSVQIEDNVLLMNDMEIKNKKLEQENEGARNFQLEMEKLKANHSLKLKSLKIILLPIFAIIVLMIAGSFFKIEINANVITMSASLFGVIIGTILAGVLGVDKKEDNQFQESQRGSFEPCDDC